MPETPRRERGAGNKTEHEAGHEAGSGPPSLPRPSGAPRADLPHSAAGLPPTPPALWATVDAALPALGIELDRAQRDALDGQIRLLFAWNAQINLTALRTPEQVARGHLLDSLSALTLLRRLTGAAAAASGQGGPSLLDLGSGPGYPGLPLAVCLPAARCALVDSVHKKAAFLEVAAAAATDALRKAGRSAPAFAVLAERAEDLAQEADQREHWDLVVARAVGTLAEVIELGLPLARVGGHVVAWKRESRSAGLRDEINASRRVTTAAGGRLPFVVAPDRSGAAGLAEHRLVVVGKARPTPDRYPRPPSERRRASLLR